MEYRTLNPEEIVQDGDERFEDSKWMPAPSIAFGLRAEDEQYRRPRISVLVVREFSFFHGNPVYVVVSCDKSPSVDSPNQFLQAVGQAVTLWVKNTESGKETYIYAGDDLNIGDICQHDADPELHKFLAETGVHNFQISHPEKSGWNYDTSLVNILEIDQ